MTREQIVAMSKAYFAAVDAMDVQSLRDLLDQNQSLATSEI